MPHPKSSNQHWGDPEESAPCLSSPRDSCANAPPFENSPWGSTVSYRALSRPTFPQVRQRQVWVTGSDSSSLMVSFYGQGWGGHGQNSRLLFYQLTSVKPTPVHQRCSSNSEPQSITAKNSVSFLFGSFEKVVTSCCSDVLKPYLSSNNSKKSPIN